MSHRILAKCENDVSGISVHPNVIDLDKVAESNSCLKSRMVCLLPSGALFPFEIKAWIIASKENTCEIAFFVLIQCWCWKEGQDHNLRKSESLSCDSERVVSPAHIEMAALEPHLIGAKVPPLEQLLSQRVVGVSLLRNFIERHTGWFKVLASVMLVLSFLSPLLVHCLCELGICAYEATIVSHHLNLVLKIDGFSFFCTD